MMKDEEWDTAVTSEEEEISIGFETQGAKPKIQQLQPGPFPGVCPSNAEVVNLFRDFIAVQQRRDDTLQEELRGQRVSVEASQQPVLQPSADGPSTVVKSARLELPTSGPRRGGPHVAIHFGHSLMSSPDRFGNPSGGVAAVHCKEPKMPVYQNGEDIENDLLRFKPLEAYTAMDEDKSNCYPDLREALLVKFDISPETYHQRFRATSSPPGETPTESYHRLKGLYRRWMRPEQKSKEQLGETIILEKLLQVLPPDTQRGRHHDQHGWKPGTGITTGTTLQRLVKVIGGHMTGDTLLSQGLHLLYVIIVSSRDTKRQFAP
ncbi:Zinc finger protein 202 [Dissostichus eleginoides]|uniref:Zinc finger protein 202 n=1 Tax=Dissostichus eleginoides TaxID=100907 RepID=A0AAD9BV15_DISEL|nr:Zinc finger protein 202 [Dissostichus eleginoides]